MSRRSLLVSLLVGVVLMLNAFAPTPAMAQGGGSTPPDYIPFEVGSYLCESQDPASCSAYAGASISASLEDGTLVGTCVTELTRYKDGEIAVCRIPLDFSTRVIVTQDPATVPAGFELESNDVVYQVPDRFVGGYEGPTVSFGSYRIPSDQPEPSAATEPEALAYPITAYFCDTDPGDYSPNGGPALGGGCEPAAGIAFSVALESDGSEVGSCTTGDDGTCSVDAPNEAQLIVTEDETTVPDGYRPRDNPQNDRNASEFRGTLFFNIATGTDPEASPEETLTAETDGSTVAIYAGTCDGDFTGEPVATLTNVRPPDGETAGADTASAVETSFTTLNLPLAELLAGDHVLVVFDEDDDSVPLACGSIGGIVTEDGTLAFGLAAVGESRFSGVVTLTEDGDQTEATILLAEDLSPEASPSA